MNMRGYPTRYEVTAKHDADGRELLLGYTARKSRQGVEAVVMGVGPEMVRALHIDPETLLVWKGTVGHLAGTAWHLGFSGRTQHESRQAGEHAYVVDIARAMSAHAGSKEVAVEDILSPEALALGASQAAAWAERGDR